MKKKIPLRCKLGLHKYKDIDTFRDVISCIGDRRKGGELTIIEEGIIKKCSLCNKKERVLQTEKNININMFSDNMRCNSSHRSTRLCACGNLVYCRSQRDAVCDSCQKKRSRSRFKR